MTTQCVDHKVRIQPRWDGKLKINIISSRVQQHRLF